MAVLNSYTRAVEMFEAGAINAPPMVSHAFSLDQYGDALEISTRYRNAAFRSARTPRHPKHSFEDWRDTHRSFCESAAPCWPPAPSPKPPHRWWQRSSEDIIETARTLAAASPAPDSTHR